MPGLMRKKPSEVRSPVMNGRSRSSTSAVSSWALCASVRHSSTVFTPSTSAARRAAFSVRTCWLIGTSTLPPRWPHFFSLASWSSKCTPAAPASIIARISSKAFSGPPNPASASATIGAIQCCEWSPSMWLTWSQRRSAALIRRTTIGTEFTG